MAQDSAGRQVVTKQRPSLAEWARQVRAEMAKVVWPSGREVWQTTLLVLLMTALLAIFFLGVDQLLGRSVRFLLSLGA